MSPSEAEPKTGQLMVISGPSGVGKSTIARTVSSQLEIKTSVSMTTRPQSAQDVEGQDYYFVTKDDFQKAIQNNELLEWAEVFGNFYGTPKGPVEQSLKDGQHFLLEIDVNGGEQVRTCFPEAIMVFILPPSDETLLQRLRNRGRDSEEVIQKRFHEAQREISQAKANGVYDHFVINDDLSTAVEEVKSYLTTG